MLKTYWPILCIVLFWFSFSFPFFFQNKVPYPSTHQVNAFSPWSRYSNYASPIKNDAMPDLIDQIYPWRHFTIEEIKKGNIPFWNPYSFSGTPHLANYQSAVFSPFTILYFIFPFVDAWSLVILAQPLLAGLFMYVYMQKVLISKTGSLIASITFMFSGFMVVWMAYGTLGMALVFLPLILFCIESFYEKKSFLPLIGISLAVSASFFSGHFQTSVYVFWVCFAYSIWKLWSTRNYSDAWWVVLYLLFGVFLTMPQLLPSIEFYQYAPRSASFTGSSGIPFYNLMTLVAPDFFGNPVTRNNLFMDYAEWHAFIGIVPFFLCLFAFSFSKKKTGLLYFFIIVGIGSLLFSLASPLQSIIGSLHIPVLSTSTPSRIIGISSFCFAVLAGFGLDVLLSTIKEKRYKPIIIRILVLGVLVSSVWIVLLLGKFLSVEHTQIAKKNFILPSIFFGIASALIFVSMYSKKRYMAYCLAVVLVGLTAFDSFRFATKWIPFDPKSLVFPEEKITTVLQKEVHTGRVFGNIGQEMTMFYHLPTSGGYDPLYIQRYGEFIASATTGEFTQSGGRTVFLDKTAKNTDTVLNILGNTLIVHPVADTNASWAYPVWEKKQMKQVYSDGVYALYKNDDALPRAKMFYSYKTITSKEKIIHQFYDQQFDYKNTLLLEESPQVHPVHSMKNTVSLTQYDPTKVLVTVFTESDGMLFLSDTYYPGWKAFVDGKETKIYRADYTFRSVPVPAGNHSILFRYTPTTFSLGANIACITLLAMGSFLIYQKTLKHS